jgi:hypothetical protein
VSKLQPFEEWLESNRSYFEISLGTKDPKLVSEEARKAYHTVEEVHRNPNLYMKKSTKKKVRKKR